jgi:hypothetical protein
VSGVGFSEKDLIELAECWVRRWALILACLYFHILIISVLTSYETARRIMKSVEKGPHLMVHNI